MFPCNCSTELVLDDNHSLRATKKRYNARRHNVSSKNIQSLHCLPSVLLSKNKDILIYLMSLIIMLTSATMLHISLQAGPLVLFNTRLNAKSIREPTPSKTSEGIPLPNWTHAIPFWPRPNTPVQHAKYTKHPSWGMPPTLNRQRTGAKLSHRLWRWFCTQARNRNSYSIEPGGTISVLVEELMKWLARNREVVKQISTIFPWIITKLSKMQCKITVKPRKPCVCGSKRPNPIFLSWTRNNTLAISNSLHFLDESEVNVRHKSNHKKNAQSSICMETRNLSPANRSQKGQIKVA